MNSHARVVVIGGGVMGVSLLYHLTRAGWCDVTLIEKNELTAGSTWHAAGLCTHFAHNPTIMALRAESVRLYRDVLPAETGLATGFHACGALRVARSPERMLEFRHVRGIGRFMGHDFHLLTPEELRRIYPLVETHGLLGAIHEPEDGHVDPSLATQAMAHAARAAGAAIHRHTAVTGVQRTAAGEWRVRTAAGEIIAEHVVDAAGTWCREIGDMLGVDLPVVPMLHQYLVTDSVPEIAQRMMDGEPELPMIRDPEESWYLRQERDGFICGPYERDARPWSVDGIPPEFGMQLLPPDLDRVADIVAQTMQRVPSLSRAGIKTVVNGPITFTPDGNPLIGPAFSLRNAWLLTGSSMGVMEGGGAGQFLARWMVDGAPPMDPLAVDARRFGGFADRDYRLSRAVECFGLQFGVHYPYEERAAGRPRRLSSVHEVQAAAGAVFGVAYGWERPNWFSSGSRKVSLTFARPGWLDAVRQECLAVRDRVGIADLSPFAKFEVLGRDAGEFVASLGANRPPGDDGRIALVHALTPAGGVASEFTLTRWTLHHYYLTSAAAAERHDEDLLRRHAEGFGDLEIRNCTESLGILGIMGPRSRSLLASLSEVDAGDDAFPFLTAREFPVAGTMARVLRVSYVGELGFELHLPMARMYAVYAAFMQAGEAHGIRPFGAYAMNSMRLEKGYRAWGMDLSTERTPLEAGLEHLVRAQGRQFQGREAMLQRAGRADAWRMVLLSLDRGRDPHPLYAHPVLGDRGIAGMVTSGALHAARA